MPIADSVLTGVTHLHLAGFEECTLALQVMGVRILNGDGLCISQLGQTLGRTV